MTQPADSSGHARPRLWSPERSPTETPPAPEAVAEVGIKTRRAAAAPPGPKPPRQRRTPAAPETVPALADPGTPAPTRYSPTIKDMPADERPRERLYAYGPQALTTGELIGILIRVGTHERSAVSLGEHLLAHFGNIKGLACASAEQLSKVKGIGHAKAAEIKAAIEFGNRLALFTEDARPAIGSPRDISNLLMPELRYLKKETLKSVLLDTKNRVQAIKMVCTVSSNICAWSTE